MNESSIQELQRSDLEELLADILKKIVLRSRKILIRNI